MVQSHWRKYADGKRTELLKKSLDAALKERERFEGDSLYEKYLSGLFHSYTNEMFKLAMIRCYSAYAQATGILAAGDSKSFEALKQKFEIEAQRMDSCLAAIEQVWGTRPELSTEVYIEESLAVDGTSPLLAKKIRLDSATNEEGAFETMSQVYRPWAKLIVDDLRNRLERHDRTLFSCSIGDALNWWDGNENLAWVWPRVGINDSQLRPKLESLIKYYADEAPVHVEPPFKGTTVGSVLDAFDKLESIGCTLEEYNDMYTVEMIGGNYPFGVEMSEITNGDFELGKLGLWVQSGSNDNINVSCKKQAAKDGTHGLHFSGKGKASGKAVSQTIAVLNSELAIELDYLINQMPKEPSCFAIKIQCYNSGGEKKLQTVYWAGSANWDAATGTPQQIKKDYYALKFKIDSEQGKWKHVRRDIPQDFEKSFGKGAYSKLGIVKMKVELLAWSEMDVALLDFYVDNVILKSNRLAPEKM